MKIVFGSGWCAHADGHSNNPRTSDMLYNPDAMHTYWGWHIETQMLFPGNDYGFIIYQSNCDVEIAKNIPDEWERNINIVKNMDDVKTQDHCHDAYSAMLSGAMFALLNNAHYVYIEQDCMVVGLYEALNRCVNTVSSMAYGFGKYSYQTGWAEESFQFVNKDFLKQYISRMLDYQLFNRTYPDPERYYHDIFADVVVPWNFGYGRKRPINYRDPIFYAQQLDDEELCSFREVIHNRYIFNG